MKNGQEHVVVLAKAARGTSTLTCEHEAPVVVILQLRRCETETMNDSVNDATIVNMS